MFSIFVAVTALFLSPSFAFAGTFSAEKPAIEDVLRAIILASDKAVVRSALLYGLLGQETGYGSYLGKTESGWSSFCASRNTSDCFNWRTYDCKADYSNARYFNEILSVLGYERKDVPVSSTCAMGYTQFEPNTLRQLLKGKGLKMLNPWDINDALAASGYYLNDLGADSVEVLGPGEVIGGQDKIALQKYYCGGNYARRECVLYTQSVEDKARRAPALLLVSDLETQLRLLEEEENRLRAQFGQEPKKLTPKTPITIQPIQPPPPPQSQPKKSQTEPPRVQGKSIYTSAIHNDHLYLVGQDTANRFRIEKRQLSSGRLESGFGDSGAVSTDAIVSHPYGPVPKQAVITFDENFIYVALNSDNRFGDDYEWRVEKRFISTGKPDISFGSAGIIRGGIKTFIPRAIAIDQQYMYIAGNDVNKRWRIEKRFISDGSLAAGFGSSGIIMGDAIVPVADYSAFFIHIDQPYMFIAGYDEDSIWRVEKRLLANGSLSDNFGESGKIYGLRTTKGMSFTMPNSMAADSSYLYIGGGFDPDVSQAGGLRHVKKISLKSGISDSGFADNGDLFQEPAPGYIAGRVIDLAISPSYLYTLSVHSGTGSAFASIERRYLSNGVIDETFGKGGEIIINDPLIVYVDNLLISGANLYFIFGYGASDKWDVIRVPVVTGIPDFTYIRNVP